MVFILSGPFKTGEAAGGPTVFEAHYPLLRLVARQYASTVSDAEDIVQEGLVRFWKYGREHALDPKAYLITCVKNAALDFLKARQARTEKERAAAEAWKWDQPLFECPVELDERRVLLEQALSRLPIEQREALVLKVWGELTFPQIGELTGTSPNTAASRYRYALLALKEQFGDRTI